MAARLETEGPEQAEAIYSPLLHATQGDLQPSSQLHLDPSGKRYIVQRSPNIIVILILFWCYMTMCLAITVMLFEMPIIESHLFSMVRKTCTEQLKYSNGQQKGYLTSLLCTLCLSGSTDSPEKGGSLVHTFYVNVLREEVHSCHHSPNGSLTKIG